MLAGFKEGDALPEIVQAMDQDRINSWAKVSGDFNRLHVNPEFAKQTRFKGTIAHGPMSLAFPEAAVPPVFEADEIREGIVWALIPYLAEIDQRGLGKRT